MTKMFNFKNMQAFVRGCVEPHVVALSTNLKAFQIHVHDTFEVLYQKLREKFAEHDKRFIAVGTVIIWPSKVDPSNMDKYLECDGRKIPITNEYAKLREICGNYTPNYNGYFVRCGNQANVGATAGDTTRSHTHSFTGSPIPSSTVSSEISLRVVGTATGQRVNIPDHTHSIAFFHPGLGYVGGGYGIQPIGPTSSKMQGISGTATTTTASSSSISGTASGTVSITIGQKTVSGSISSSGSGETAPRHIYARYLIRALP